MRVKAVVFDLWETLIDWDRAAAARMLDEVLSIAGRGFGERWSASTLRYVAPIRVALADAGVAEESVERICSVRLRYHRAALVPRPGAVETLRELRRRGVLTGLITVCSEDIEVLWPESMFAGLFDAEVFSSAVGLSKPDPRIYRHCLEQLGVDAAEAVFVGDGANDELAGARRVGMEAILIHRPDEEPCVARARGVGRPARVVDPGRYSTRLPPSPEPEKREKPPHLQGRHTSVRLAPLSCVRRESDSCLTQGVGRAEAPRPGQCTINGCRAYAGRGARRRYSSCSTRRSPSCGAA